MIKSYWGVKHTQLGTSGQWSFFKTKKEAEQFSREWTAAGGGADEPKYLPKNTQSQWEDIDAIELDIYLRRNYQ